MKKIADKLKVMGIMGPRKHPVETGNNKMMTFMMALIVAVPVSTIVAYIVMPQQLNDFLSLSSSQVGHQKFSAKPQIRNMNRIQEPQWLMQQRAEFKKRNAGNYLANRSPSEPPQWVKNQQALQQQAQEKYQQQWAKYSVNTPYSRVQNQAAYPRIYRSN